MKKEAHCLSHYANARNDPKILILRSIYGLEGYGRYWVLIEMLREQADCKIMLNKYIWNALAMQMQCTADEAHAFVEFCIEEACLLASDGDAFWSPSLMVEMKPENDAKNARSERARKAAEARWGKASRTLEDSAENARVMLNECTSNANASNEHTPSIAEKMPEQCKRKEKEAKRKELKDLSLPPYNPPKDCEAGTGVGDALPEEETNAGADIAEVFTAYGNNIHPVTGEIEADKLNDLLTRYGKVWLIAAIERAVSRNKRSLSYIEGILRNWGTEGFDGGGGGNGQGSGDNPGVHRARKKSPAGRKEVDWSKEPKGLPPI